MANDWAAQADIEHQLPNVADFCSDLADGNAYIAEKITQASDRARSYLNTYHYFFASWVATTVPTAVKSAVVAIAVHLITSRKTKLAANALEKTTWERDFDDAIAWLKDVANGKATLDVEWPLATDATSGHRAVVAGTRTPELG